MRPETRTAASRTAGFGIGAHAWPATALLLIALILTGTGCSLAQPGPGPDRKSVQALVAREARNLGVPVPLALAVAHAESNFDPAAMSHKGARGVMQIMPATARGEYGIEADLLWDARINVRVGLHYLGRLLQRYRGRSDLALSFYNGGSRVGRLPNARVIPATRGYVDKVHRLERRYRRQLARGRLSNLLPASLVLSRS